MDSSLQYELNDCIRELRSIASELESMSRDIKSSISGMSLFTYTWTLEDCARKYRSAANQLSRIQ